MCSSGLACILDCLVIHFAWNNCKLVWPKFLCIFFLGNPMKCPFSDTVDFILCTVLTILVKSSFSMVFCDYHLTDVSSMKQPKIKYRLSNLNPALSHSMLVTEMALLCYKCAECGKFILTDQH